MANVIQRLVQLVLDKRAASQMESQAKRSLGGIDKALGGLRATVLLVGSSLAAVFGIRALGRFIEGAITAAKEADRIWNDLAGTINAAGQSFADLEPKIRATAAAFQAATTVGDEEFAAGLTRLISLTGDVESSLNNMGLVANVAAQFFGGKLEPAIELVAKVSTGYITQLQRMGIAVKSAQEGLDVLGQRSAGAAARQMETLSGQTQALTNAIDDFKEALGYALFNIDGANSSVAVFTAGVQNAEKWVTQNRSAIHDWVDTGWRALIIIIDAAYRSIRGLGELFVGSFQYAIGTVISAVGWLATGLADLNHIVLGLSGGALKLLGFDKQADAANELAAGVDAVAASIKKAGQDFKESGLGFMGQGASRMAHRTAFADALLNEDGGPSGAPDPTTNRGMLPPGSTKPKDGSGAPKKDAIDAVSASFAKYADRLQQIAALSQLLGGEYDANGEKLSAIRQHMNELVETGDQSLTPYLQGLVQQMQGLAVPTNEVNDALQDFDHQMQSIDIQSAAMGNGFDALSARASALEGIIANLAALGESDALLPFVDQLNQIRAAMQLAEDQAADYGLAVSNLTSLIVGSVGGSLGEVAKAKAKENLLLAAEQTAHGIVSLLNPFTAGAAPGHFAQAAKFGAIAAGWSALGSVAGGGGGSGALAGARGGTGAASEQSDPPGPEISIYLTGDMNALDARVQKWVLGATEAGRERYGENAIVRTVPRRG